MKCITLLCIHTSQTQNLWLWPKRPPLAFSVAETSVAEMSWPKCPGRNVHGRNVRGRNVRAPKQTEFGNTRKITFLCFLTMKDKIKTLLSTGCILFFHDM